MHRCLGTIGRRDFLRTGLAGLSSLGLADLLRMEGRAAGESPGEKSLILFSRR